MRRQTVIGIVLAGLVVGVGMAAWGNAHGWFASLSKPNALLARAQQAVAQGELSVAQAQLEEIVGMHPDSSVIDQAMLELGRVYEAQRQLIEARAMYRLLLERFPDSPLVGEAQAHLGAVNVALLFSPVITETDLEYDVKPGDTLGKIAALHHTTVELVKRANELTSDLIRPKQTLKVPTSNFRVVVDKSQNQLLLTADDQFFKTYPVATGAENSTPVGTFTIVNKVPNPVWYRQGAVVPPDSPKNILGTRWMGLSQEGYGIHGSVDPEGIGQQVTAGCVRMHNTDVEELFAIVPTGTEVTIVE